MNAKDFLDLMGEIDGDLIVNAKEPIAPRRAPAWRKLTVIAAAACLLVGILSALVLIGMQQNVGDELPRDTEAVIESPEESPQPDHGTDFIETPTSFDTTDQPEDDSQIDAPYTVLVVGPYDGSGVIEGAEYVIKEYDTYTDSTVDQKYVLPTDDGQSLEFVYQNTNSESFNGLLIHTYEAENGVEIRLNETLDQIVFYNEKAVYKPDENKPQMSEQECLQIAQDYLMSLTEHADQYEYTHLLYDYDGDKQGGPCYGFQFTRLLGNYTTYDVLIVSVSKTGDITVYNQCKFGCADGITLPSEQEYAEMQASAIKAMEKMYEGRKYTYELRDVYISYDAQGKLAVEFMIDMDVWPQNADDDARPWAELCHLLIYPEDLVTEDTQKNAQ